MILVDSNILIDVLEDEQEWREWSIDQLVAQTADHRVVVNQIAYAEVAPRMTSLESLVALTADHRVVVNQIAYAEVAPRMTSLESLEARLAAFEIDYEPFGEEAAFLAGSAFLEYRTRRKDAKMVLPDFFIGGHAQAAAATILTRDPRFYRTYFPTVPLITPDKTET